MDQQIKFRQWDGTRFHYWGFIDGVFIGPKDLVRPSEQYTGVNDRKGVEVYKGDIMYSKQWDPCNQEVTFNRGGFCLKNDESGYYPDIKYVEQMEIIGNTHENPEYLKR